MRNLEKARQESDFPIYPTELSKKMNVELLNILIMANWAQTEYEIEGNLKDLQEIYELFCKFDKGERKPFDELTAKNGKAILYGL